MALTKGRNTLFRTKGFFGTFKIAAATKPFNGGLACVNSAGYLVPGSNTAGLRCVGVCDKTVDNTGAAGALSTDCQQGVFKFKNSGTKPCTQEDMLRPVFIEDDETVA